MRHLVSIVLAFLVAGVGCWLSAQFIPGGTPRLLAQCGSVLAGFGVAFGGYRWLGP